MKEAISVKIDIKEEVGQEHFSDCKFQDPCKNEDVTDIPDYVKPESDIFDIKYEPKIVSFSVVKEERQYTQIKKDITEVHEINDTCIVEDIKSEEIEMKYERFDDTRLSSTKPTDILKREDLNLIEDKTATRSAELNDKDAEGNMSANLETPIYQCTICQHKTRRKINLQYHMLVHTDPSTTSKYECSACTYKSRRKADLQKHMLVHTDPSKATMYECSICRFKTRWKSYLKRHRLVHMDASKTTVYECNTCPYKTRLKAYLKSHMLVHTDPSKISMYECDICRFKTRWKSSLTKHMSVHTNPTTAIYECESCSYKTRRKSDLRRHVTLVHMKPKMKYV